MSNFTLTRESYHSKEANAQYASTSQIKSFLECPAKAMAELRGEYERPSSTALLQGSFLDALFEGTEEQFMAENKVCQRNGSLYKHFDDAVNAYNRIKQDPVMYRLCTGEQQIIMTGEIQGVPVKIMIDSLHDDMIVDRKYMRDFKDMWVDGAQVSFAEGWGYDIQAAIYQTIVEQNTGKKLPFALACVSKETVPDIGMFLMSQDTIDNAMGIVRANIERIQAMKNGTLDAENCGDCDWCKQTRKVSEDMNDWRIL